MADVNSNIADAWALFWRGRAMPVMPASVVGMAALIRRADRVSPAEIATLVLRDPLLTLQVLRFINQRERSTLAAEMVSIEKTVMLMGVLPFLERFGRQASLERIVSAKEVAIWAKINDLVTESVLLVNLARDYAALRYDARLDEIIVAALFTNLNPLLSILAPYLDHNAPAAAETIENLLTQFKIPNPVLAFLLERGEAAPRETLQHAVARLVWAGRAGWWSAKVTQEINFIAGALTCEPGDVWQIYCQQILKLARQERELQRDFAPARYLPMLPGDWPEERQPEVAEAVQKPDPLSLHMQALHLAGHNGTNSNEIMNLSLKALSDGLGMQRILFALHSPADRTLRARFLRGVSDHDPLHNLTVPLDVPHLLTQLMQKPQGFWYSQANAGRFKTLLPEILLRHVQHENFCVMSIFVGAKPVGMIYADRHGTDDITDFHYQHFKQICMLTSKALTSRSAHSIQ